MSCAVMFPAPNTLKAVGCHNESAAVSPLHISSFSRRPYYSCENQVADEGPRMQGLKGSPCDLRVHNEAPESTPCSAITPGCSATSLTAEATCGEQQSQNTEHASSPHDYSNSRTDPAQTGDVKYLSANCVLVTHYRGDVSDVVDEHFARALTKNDSKGQSARGKNFPPSFYQPQMYARPAFNFGNPFASTFTAHTSSELYEAYHGGLHALQAQGVDPWSSYNTLAAQTYGHRGMGYDVYGSSMTNTHSYQYPSISGLQQPFSRIPNQISKHDPWASRYYDSFTAATDLSGSLESAYPSAHYPSHTGLETGVADCQKELYWV